MTASVLSGLVLLLAGAGIALAPPAAAVDDPTRPDARVTFGPSCNPGGLVIEVTGGTAPYFVRLATTRQPGGEDQATVAPGTTVVLRSGDVDWGETIDGRLEYAARDGSGATFVDELDNYSFTRPTQEDCDAANDPTQPHPSPPPSSGPAAGAPSAPQQPGDATAATPIGTAGGGTTTDRTSPSSRPSSRPSSSESQQAQAGGAFPSGPAPVAPGDTVTVNGTGFLPGERVVVALADGAVLGSATAAGDGSVRARIHIPQGTENGPTTVTLVGDDSAVVAGVELHVAASTAPAGDGGAADLVPLVAAATALVATAAGLASASRRRPARGSA